MAWRRYWVLVLSVAGGLAATVYVLVLVVDPFDTVWFSPPFDREPISANQRFSYPALARKDRFDSAVFGTSSSRLLAPKALNAELGVSFVNLSMNSATAYEQSRIFDVFARHHPKPKYVIFGVDRGTWCDTNSEELSFRHFPPWMYDDNPWNDLLHLFNAHAMEEMGRQLAYLTGLRPPKRGKDGYTRFVPPKSEYDLERARQHIYGSNSSQVSPAIVPPVTATPAQLADWKFDSHRLMAKMVDRLPEETIKILLFVPSHQVDLPTPGSLNEARLDNCKDQLVATMAGRNNVHALDFMLRSEITTRDENFWDASHYTVDIAGDITRLIAEAIGTRRDRPGYFRYLRPG